MENFFLTNKEIDDLVNEPKPVGMSTNEFMQKMKRKSGRAASFLQNSHAFQRQHGEGEWLLYARINEDNLLDFSCGLGFIPKARNKVFILRRFNGKSHQHTNKLDGHESFYDFHIHQATEKYQNSSYADEHYAERTDRYTRLEQALDCLLQDCKVTMSAEDNNQGNLFD